MNRLLTLCIAGIAAVSTFALPYTTQVTSTSSPIDTVDVVCYDLTLNTNYLPFGMALIYANNAEYKLTAAIYADSIPPGTYSEGVLMDLKHIATGKMIAAKTVSITLSVDANKHCVIHGTMLGEDNILYNLNLFWSTPTQTKVINITFDTPATVAYYPDLKDDFKLSNQNDDYNVTLNIAGVEMGETFTEKDITRCIIASKSTQDTITIASAEGEIWQSNDTTYMTANVLGFDSILYDIDLWYVVPTPYKTVKLNFSNATFYNQLEKDGYYALIGTSEDKSIEFAISLLGNTEEDIAGIYINDGMFGGFTGQNYDFLIYVLSEYATYIATDWNEEKGDYDKISTIEKGEAEITMDAEQNITLTGTFISKDSIKYEITLTTKVEESHFDDDMASGAIDCIITGNEITLEDQTTTNGSIFFDVITDNELLALYFYAEAADPDIVIPEGTYSIDYSQDYWSVNASDGTISTYPSFYATHDGIGFTSMYFFVSGTVEVKKKNGKLYMEINALNSYDVPAHIIYDGSLMTSVENANAKNGIVEKRFENGQIMIIRNGKKYNTVGVQVK